MLRGDCFVMRSVAVFIVVLGICLSGFWGGGVRRARAMAIQPAEGPGGTPAGVRTPEELKAEVQRLSRSLTETIGPRETLLDPAQREALAIQAVPVLQDLLAVSDEIARSQIPNAMGVAFGVRHEAETMLCVFGDAATIQRVERLAGSGAVGWVAARKSLLFAKWIHAGGDVERQQAVLDEVDALAQQVPANDVVTQLLVSLSEAQPADDATSARIDRIISTRLTGPVAKQVAQRRDAQRKLARMVDKPLLILGVRFNGEMFSTKIWRGRPVMVIFWASTSPACQEQAPEWRRVFQRYREDGLEVVGVNNDATGEEMLRFLSTQPGMVWPQLHDKQQPGWHALSTELGVTELPTVMLIDKAGVLRAVNPADLEGQVRKLLAE